MRVHRQHRRQFGNLLLSRLPVRHVWRHLLPWPGDADHADMQRIAVEAVIEAPDIGELRVTTTGLILPSSMRSGPGRENQPSVIHCVSPSLNSSVAVPLKRTVTAPGGICSLPRIAQPGSTGGSSYTDRA